MVGIPDTPENEAACLCGNCPSKPAGGGKFYCAQGSGDLPVTRGFCACRWCPLWSGYGLSDDFYCDAASGRDGSTND